VGRRAADIREVAVEQMTSDRRLGLQMRIKRLPPFVTRYSTCSLRKHTLNRARAAIER
jgi:hypothetical protein